MVLKIHSHLNFYDARVRIRSWLVRPITNAPGPETFLTILVTNLTRHPYYQHIRGGKLLGDSAIASTSSAALEQSEPKHVSASMYIRTDQDQPGGPHSNYNIKKKTDQQHINQALKYQAAKDH